MASIEVLAFDRSRLLSDVTRVVSEHHLNIVASSSQTAPDRVSRMRFDVRTGRPGHLDSLLSSLKHLDGVFDAFRTSARPKGLTTGGGGADRTRRRYDAPAGTHDVLWPESEPVGGPGGRLRRPGRRAGFGLALTPLFEDARLFHRGIGGESEVVNKEMYEFTDRSGRPLALRPEGTAPVVRAFVQHHPPVPWKAWYVTPAFRYEEPQAGRYRQHHQVGVEVLGPRTPISTSRSSPWPPASTPIWA